MARKNEGIFARLRHPRHFLFLLILVLAPWPLRTVLPLGKAIVAGFDFAALCFILSCVPLWNRGKASGIRRSAQRDDVGRAQLLLLTGGASTVVLGMLVVLIRGEDQLSALNVAVLIATLIASWSFANLSFAFHYAHLYYSPYQGKDCGGLDFHSEEEPDFSDFVNFAFVIGMTCQTADIDIISNRMRRISTFHGLFAFAFNLGVLALAVNVLGSGH